MQQLRRGGARRQEERDFPMQCLRVFGGGEDEYCQERAEAGDGRESHTVVILCDIRIYRTALVKHIWLALCSRVTREF